MRTERRGFAPVDPPPGGLARLRAALDREPPPPAWLPLGVAALAALVLAAALPALLAPPSDPLRDALHRQAVAPTTAWQSLPSVEPQVKVYLAMPAAPAAEP